MNDLKIKSDLAILDVRTVMTHREILRIRKAGGRIKVVITGYLEDEDWSDYDGVSVEQAVKVESISATVEK